MNPTERIDSGTPQLPFNEEILIKERINQFLAHLLNANPNQDLKSFYEELFLFFNEFSKEDFGCLLEAGRLPKLLSLTPNLKEEQKKLAFLLAQKNLDWAAENENPFSFYTSAMDYAAVALKIAETDTPFAQEIHLFTSKVFLQLALKNRSNDLKNQLSTAMRSADSNRFILYLESIERLRNFCSDERDKILLSPYLKAVYNEVTAFSREIRHDSGDAYKNAINTAIVNSTVPLHLAPQLLTTRYLQLFEEFRNTFKKSLLTSSIREFQNDLFKQFQQFFAELVADIFVILGPPPCMVDGRARDRDAAAALGIDTGAGEHADFE